MANDLVRHSVSVLVAFTTPAALAAKAATTTTPIVFTISDPVATGLVTSLSRPDGNITGTSYLSVEIGPKLLELLCEAIPATASMALLSIRLTPRLSLSEQSCKLQLARSVSSCT
jgi:putative ABC transport system substrate-binding protein